MRSLLLYNSEQYNSEQTVVARSRVPLRHMDPDLLAALAYDLEGVFGKGWMD
ncbi:hypothetical protein AB0D67_10630 [Streptosporangium sp. NPDC048047]|uniref:hypothetical protein n=1 Tax=Streptosporangium sp. NPDC048047 TaxID=3155748 RepID=UPI00341737A2